MKVHIETKSLLASAIFSVAMLISCGGGGGEGSSSPSYIQSQEYFSDINATVNPQTTTQTLTSQNLDGSLRKLQTVSSVKFRLEVESLDGSGKIIEKKVLEVEPGKPKSIRIKLDENGGVINIIAKAEGYSEAAKSFKYNSPEEIKQISVDLTPKPVRVKIIDINQGISIQSNGKKYVRFAFIKDSSGMIKLSTDFAEISKASTNGQKILDVSIPLNKLQQNIQKLRVEYRDFQPSKPEDYRNFPGEETVDGEKLISFGFDFLRITDQNGNDPFTGQDSQNLSAARFEGEYFRILRYVDCIQIQKMKDSGILIDEDEQKPGIQFTFWAFDWDEGGWVKAGQGIFVSKGDVSYYDYGDNEADVDTVWDYIIKNGCINDTPCDPDNPSSSSCIDVNNDGIQEDVSCEGNSVIQDIDKICTEGEGWVVVSVTNPSLEWKNLDYIVPGNQQVCCSLTVQNDSGNPVSGAYLYVNPIDNSIAWTEGITDGQGKVEICTVVYDQNNPKGMLYVYNPYTWSYEEQEINFNSCPSSPIEVRDPYKCSVQGKVVDESGNPLKDIFIEVYSDDYLIYRWGYTDEQGNFSIPVVCGVDLTLRANDTSIPFSVNGSLDNNERSDNYEVVELNDIQLQNNPPLGYVYPWDYKVKVGESVRIDVCAWDWEGNYPITYQIKSSLENTLSSPEGQIDEGEGCETVEYSADNYGQENIEVIFIDSVGKGTTVSTSIEVSKENTSPEAYIYGYILDSNSYIYIYAYDEDGDDLTWNIDYTCNDKNNNQTEKGNIGSGEFEDGWGEEEITFNPQNTDTKECKFTLSVTDSQGSSTTESLTLQYVNNPPTVYLWADTGVYVTEGTQQVTVYANIHDDDMNISCTWYVNGIEQEETSCESYTLDLSNAKAGNVYEVKLEVVDGFKNRVEKSINIIYGEQGNANIVIQQKS